MIKGRPKIIILSPHRNEAEQMKMAITSRIVKARDYFQQFKEAASEKMLNRVSHRYHLPLKGCGTTIPKVWAPALVGLAHAAEFELVARADWSVLESA